MRTLAFMVEMIWRSLCDSYTYMPHQIGSEWLTEVFVEDGVVYCGQDPQDASLTVTQLEFHLTNAMMTYSVGG